MRARAARSANQFHATAIGGRCSLPLPQQRDEIRGASVWPLATGADPPVRPEQGCSAQPLGGSRWRQQSGHLDLGMTALLAAASVWAPGNVRGAAPWRMVPASTKAACTQKPRKRTQRRASRENHLLPRSTDWAGRAAAAPPVRFKARSPLFPPAGPTATLAPEAAAAMAAAGPTTVLPDCAAMMETAPGVAAATAL